MARVTKQADIKRGEIWVTDLRPGVGWEVAKKRPSLIVSSNAINTISPVVIVVPISSQIPEVLGPERLLLHENEAVGLTKKSVILITQIRAIDKTRLVKRVGTIKEEKLLEVEGSIKLVLGMTELD